VPIFARSCLAGEPLTIYGSGAQTRSFTSVHDVVHANLLAAEAARAGRQAFNCASGIAVSIKQLADFVLAETGSAHAIDYAPARAGDIERFAVDNTKLARLGLQFDTDWRGMVRDVVAWSARSPSGATVGH